jgi:hypothetical protein
LSLLVNHQNKWAFIHVPKTAGTSISYVLNQYPSTKNLVSHETIRYISHLKDYFTFAFVRNPFTRTVSAYFHNKRKYNEEISFGDFLKTTNVNELWMLPQNYFLDSGTKDVQLSFLGKYETLQHDTSVLFNKLEINQKIPHLNKNSIYEKHPNLKQEDYYKFFYEKEWMKDWVRERYYNDFKIFNYGMDI